MSDRRKLTPAQRAALETLAKCGPDAIARRAAYLGNRTYQPAPFCAVIHAGTAENLNRRGLVRIVYPPHILGNTLEITDAGRAKLADLVGDDHTGRVRPWTPSDVIA